MKKLLSLIALLGFVGFAQADDVQVGIIGPFGTLNNTDSSVIIPANAAQDLLNVDITPGGKSVKKRKGYAQAFALPITTAAVHGVYSFYDASGNDVALFFNDTRITASVAGGSATTIYSTGTAGVTWQCVDSQGFAYCANSSRTGIYKTQGTTFSYLGNFTSTGTMVAMGPERMFMAGFASIPNEIDFSAANDFTNWTVGSQPTSPITFTITAPGAKITHIVYAHKRYYWFKDSSFGYILPGSELADWQIRTVSPEIGTLDNTSTQDTDGNLYFRGQNGHIYMTDGTQVVKLSRDVAGIVTSAGTQTTNSWTQTTTSDFSAGSLTSDLSTSTSTQLSAKTTSFTLTAGSDFAAGSSGSSVYCDTTTTVGNLQTTFPDTFAAYRNGTGSTKQVWKNSIYGSVSPTATNGKIAVGYVVSVTNAAPLPPPTNYGATYYFRVDSIAGSCSSLAGIELSTMTDSEGAWYNASAPSGLALQLNCAGSSQINLTLKDKSSSSNQTAVDSGGTTSNSYSVPCDLYIWASTYAYTVTVNSAQVFRKSWSNAGFSANRNIRFGGGIGSTYFDSFNVAPQTFNWSSPTYDTGIVIPIWSTFTATTSGTGTASFRSQVSDNQTNYNATVAETSGSLMQSAAKRYVRFVSTFSLTDITASAPFALESFDFNAGSSGTYQSAVKNAPNITSWGGFDTNQAGSEGALTYYIRAQNSSFAVGAGSPAFSLVTAGGLPTVSTGTYFQIKAVLQANNASQPAILYDFTQNWFEGGVADKAYATFHDDKVMFSVAYGDGQTTNNRQLVYDLLNKGWTLYDFPANGFYKKNGDLYFGSSLGGYIYKFGDTENDNGAAIEAYWKSKDFFADSPFVEREYANLSLFAGVEQSTITVTYTINGSSSSAYNVALYKANTTSLRSNKNLYTGQVGGTLNVKFGNDAADQPFEIYAVQYGYRPRSWRPE